MPDTKEPRMADIPKDRSVIVVSDLHLGSSEDPETSRRFCRFLDYVETRMAQTPMVCCQGAPDHRARPHEEKTLMPPEKIILLGDVFELWDTRNTDRNNAVLDGLYPFLKLRDMDCDIVYVTGNHDEDVGEFIASRAADEQMQKSLEKSAPVSLEKPPGTESGVPHPCDQRYQVFSSRPGGKKTKRPECLIMNLKKSPGTEKPRKFELCRRHYPAISLSGGEEGLRVGGKRYAFVHGQQFDPVQIIYTISEILGERFDPVDFIQDLASVSASRNLGLIPLVLNILLTIALLAIPMTTYAGSVIPLLGFWFGIVLVFILVYGSGLFAIQDRKDAPSGLIVGAICAALALGTLLLVVFLQFFWLYVIVVAMSLFITMTIAFPRFIAFIKKGFYNLISVKEESPGEIIEKKRFIASDYRYNSEVLVFGHTHIPDFGDAGEKGGGPLLVNTGTWVRDRTNAATHDWDAFAYIDRNGICLMRWVDKGPGNTGHIECLCRRKPGDIEALPLCRYW